MSVSLWVGNKPFEIGSVSFLKSLFSTVYIKLEGQNWGKLFPTIMNEFYTGELDYKRCDKAVEEIMKIREMLREFQPDQIVWDFENLEKIYLMCLYPHSVRQRQIKEKYF
jgi:hypothetical protein